jgi:ParB/RepB/Spo0J family partition protein
MATDARMNRAAPLVSGFDYLPVESIRPSTSNPRRFVENAKFAELVASVTTHGVIEPIVVRPDPKANGAEGLYELVAGERRWRAAKAAGLALVPAVIKTLTDDELLEMQLIENLQREDLSPLEQARGYRMLLDRNPAKYSAAAIATRLGLSEKWVWDRLKLLDLVPEAQQLLQTDRMGVGHAILIARLKPADQKRVIHPDSRALFTNEAGFDFDEARKNESGPKPGKYDDYKPRSVRELDAWIAKHIRFDVAHMAQAAPLEFASTAAAVETASALPGRGTKVVPITHDWTCPQDAKDETERTYGSSAWKRANGQEGSTRCAHAVLGVIAAGAGYGRAFDVCIARDRCEVHWKREIQDRAKSAKAGAVRGGSAAGTKAQERSKAREQRDAAARQARDARWKVFAPSLRQAVAAAAGKFTTVPGPVFAQVLKHHRLPATTTVARLPHALLVDALTETFAHAWHHDEPKMRLWAKVLKVDVRACEPKASADTAKKATRR